MVGRRRFMLWLGAVGASLFSRSRLGALSGARCRSRLAAAATGLFSDPAGVRDLGRRYLALHPAEGDAARLERRIGRRLLGHPLASPDELRRAVAIEVKRDFSHGRVVLVDGWVVSQLEARLAARCAMD